ncbi:MAG: rhodanese-like domain-containing protein [Hydrogenophaga sp.]|nr:rhodanese-like domain-containing protein [Hydrogenophaga sp.]
MLEEAKQVCPTTTRRLVGEGAWLVDVRERTEVACTAFDVPAIVNIPLTELEQRWSELPKDRELVLVCESGERSLKATYFLQYHGYTRVSNMEGGILKWMRKNFPVIGQRIEVPAAASSSCCCSAPADQASSTGCC